MPDECKDIDRVLIFKIHREDCGPAQMTEGGLRADVALAQYAVLSYYEGECKKYAASLKCPAGCLRGEPNIGRPEISAITSGLKGQKKAFRGPDVLCFQADAEVRVSVIVPCRRRKQSLPPREKPHRRKPGIHVELSGDS